MCLGTKGKWANRQQERDWTHAVDISKSGLSGEAHAGCEKWEQESTESVMSEDKRCRDNPGSGKVIPIYIEIGTRTRLKTLLDINCINSMRWKLDRLQFHQVCTEQTRLEINEYNSVENGGPSLRWWRVSQKADAFGPALAKYRDYEHVNVLMCGYRRSTCFKRYQCIWFLNETIYMQLLSVSVNKKICKMVPLPLLSVGQRQQMFHIGDSGRTGGPIVRTQPFDLFRML